MKLGPFLIMAAIVSAVFGLLFVLVPVYALGNSGMEVNDAGIAITRIFGAHLVGLASAASRS